MSRGRRGTAGESLIEVLIALVVLGVAGAAGMAAFATGVRASGLHRHVTNTDVDARNFSDRLVRAIDTKSLPYVACAGTAAYSSPSGFTPAAGDSASVTRVEYWNGSAFVTSGCTVANDSGIQRVTVLVNGPDANSATRLQMIVRKPCLVIDVTSGPCP